MTPIVPATASAGSSRHQSTLLVFLLLVAFTFLAASTVSAQADKTIGLGGGIAFYRPLDDKAHNSTGFALVYRFGKPEGWRPAVGFNWFNTRFDARIGGEDVELGQLRVRPVMGGYGYTKRYGRLAATASAVGGVAFNSFREADPARIAYTQSLQRTLLRVEARNSLAARGEVSVWYDLNSRIGLMAVAGYVHARPKIDIVSDLGTETRRLKADSIKLQVGMAYGIF